jgi:vitamin B12 transport system substrate-binding protein
MSIMSRQSFIRLYGLLWLSAFSFTALAEQEGKESTKSLNHDVNKAQRIIALAPHIVEMLFEIGVGDKIIGTTEHSDFPAQANDIPRIGNYARLKIEKILTYDPDLIIAWRTGNPSDDLARLKQLGLNIVYSDPMNLTDVAKELRFLGKLTGAEKQAELKAKKFEAKLLNLQEHYKNKKAISVFYELWSRPLTTVANNAWPQQSLNICGTVNPFINSKTDYPQINVEQVVLSKPQLIIQPQSEGHKNPDAIDWQQWQEIPASKNKLIIGPNSDKLHRMSTRLLDELEILCESIDQARSHY